MFDNTLHIPLKFYTAVEKQDRFRAFSTTKKFIQWTDEDHLPEFQIKADSSDNFSTVKLVNVDTYVENTVTMGSDFYEVDFTGFTYLIYNRILDLSSPTPPGDYYLKVTTSSADVYYSEVFSVGDIIGKTIFEYYNSTDIGGIDYTNGDAGQYKSTLIVDTTMAKPEYVIEEEAVEDGDGNVMVTFQRHVKKFKLWFHAPEHIADAVALIPLHDYVTLTTNYGQPDQSTGRVYDPVVTVEWLETKGLAKITIDFRDTAIIKTNCANNLT